MTTRAPWWLVAVAVACAAQTASECDGLVPGLTSASADARERAARTLYKRCPVDVTGAMGNLRASLRKSVELGNANAGALLLLGRYRDAETREFLEQRVAATAPKLKLDPWQKPVPVGLAAAVAAVSAGSPNARERLKEALKPVEEAEFLTSVLPSIQDNKSLDMLLALLVDERTVSTGVPSGATPRRRIADLAADGLASRFSLTEFKVRPGDRYTRGELEQIRRLVTAKLR
ncbi:MAG: hypothetical protein HY820_17705 [Acidobacteria bacterium]|nr:hypothetical protein [Acidobacteriota bacterium]